MSMSHHYPLQIFYEDTDAAGIVYHANYIKYMERARTLLLQQKGLSLAALIDTFGVQFLVRAVNISYEKPVRLQQHITVVTNLAKFGRASLTFSQNIYFDPHDMDTMICSGEVVIVCTDLQFKPCAIPATVLKELKE
ncbi:MAG: YbgC/FadM family acyl-CoA thioesterase [Gammaproteobacteria bacterium]|nr:YbgC/FadM family acyl-CoA thioesterase [Gammaproteobacteria bacterium]